MSGLAVASLVLGLVPVVPVIGSILAFVFGIIAEKQINGSKGQLRGRGMAIEGTILGFVSLIAFAFAVWYLGQTNNNGGGAGGYQLPPGGG